MKLISLNIFPETLQEVRREAKYRGLPMAGLIRMILMEWLREERKKRQNEFNELSEKESST